MFAFPAILTCHTIGMGVAAGIKYRAALRILGVGPGIPIQELPRFLSIMWFGFWLNAISGVALLVAYPTKALDQPGFLSQARTHRRRGGAGKADQPPGVRRGHRLLQSAAPSSCWPSRRSCAGSARSPPAGCSHTPTRAAAGEVKDGGVSGVARRRSGRRAGRSRRSCTRIGHGPSPRAFISSGCHCWSARSFCSTCGSSAWRSASRSPRCTSSFRGESRLHQQSCQRLVVPHDRTRPVNVTTRRFISRCCSWPSPGAMWRRSI